MTQVPRHEQNTSLPESLHLAASSRGTPYLAATSAAAASLAAWHVAAGDAPPATATTETFMCSGPAAATRLCTAKYHHVSPDTSTTCFPDDERRITSTPR